MLGFLGRFAPNQITCDRLGCTATGDVGKAFVKLQRQLSNVTGQKLTLDGRITSSHVALISSLAMNYPKQFGAFSFPLSTMDVAQLAAELTKAIGTIGTGAPAPTFTNTLPTILPIMSKPTSATTAATPAQDSRGGTTTTGVPLPDPFPEPPEPGKTDQPSMPETTADGGSFPYPIEPLPLPTIDPSKITIVPLTAFSLELNQKQIVFGSIALAAVTVLGVIGGVVVRKRRKSAVV